MLVNFLQASTSRSWKRALFSFSYLLLFSHWVCPPLWDLMDCSMLGLPVFHYLLEFAQTHFHWVSYATQLFHPLYVLLLLSSIFPSIRVFSRELILCIRWPKYQSFSFTISPSNEYSRLISFSVDCLDLLAKGLSRVFSSTTDQKHQFFGAQLSLWSNSHIHTWLLEKPYLWLDGPLLTK